MILDESGYDAIEWPKIIGPSGPGGSVMMAAATHVRRGGRKTLDDGRQYTPTILCSDRELAS